VVETLSYCSLVHTHPHNGWMKPGLPEALYIEVIMSHYSRDLFWKKKVFIKGTGRAGDILLDEFSYPSGRRFLAKY